MSEFDDYFALVDDLFAEVYGVEIEIHRGASSTAGVTAEATIVEHKVRDADGFSEMVRLWEWIIDTADYTIDGLTVEPQRNDQIKRTIDGEVNIFRVLPPGENQACFEYADPDKNQLVVHTKLVGTE